MKTAHTPGPWQVFHDHPDGGRTAQQLGFIRPAGTSYRGADEIATVHLCETQPQQAANAQLIAMAPQLLEELRTTTMYLHSACLVITDPESRRLALQRVEESRAVIAKAISQPERT